MEHDKTGSIFNKGSIFGGSTTDMMKRSPSEMALRELFATENDDKVRCDGGAEVVAGDGVGGDDDHIPSFPTYSSEFQAGFSFPTSLGQFSSPSPYPIQSNVSATIDSQSSVCADSPSSAYNPKSGGNRALGASSGSSHERLDEDDELEIEAGPCEQSTNPPDVRRIRRMVSNRQSAQRSRRRKQAHLTDLEQQVEQLRGESSSLFKQLADATQQFKDATTNNRVLRSDVEALRAKVKLAEDMVARGSLTTSLNHLLQNYLNTAQDCMNNATIPAANIPPPMVPVCGNDNSPYTRILTEPTGGLDNPETFSQNIPNGAIPSTVHNSQMPDTWPWESHIAPVSK